MYFYGCSSLSSLLVLMVCPPARRYHRARGIAVVIIAVSSMTKWLPCTTVESASVSSLYDCHVGVVGHERRQELMNDATNSDGDIPPGEHPSSKKWLNFSSTASKHSTYM